MKKKEFTAIGLMSGTSMDGIDASIVKSDGISEFTSISDEYFEFDNKIYDKLINLRNKISSIQDLDRYADELNEAEREFTLFNTKIIENISKGTNENIDLIGFHGQTIYHKPDLKISKQLGDGNLLSQITKKIVINNFRENDLINGGQGAPLTPIFHSVLSKIIKKKFKVKKPISIINIGGITNITQINDTEKSELIAFDIGPGNCLINEWVRKNSKKKFDKDGAVAKSGMVNEMIYNQSIDNFDINDYRKSLDIKDFDLSFVKGLSFEDGAATLTKFTAFLIAKGINYIFKSNNSKPSLFLVSGGGRKNSFLIDNINAELKKNEIKLENIDEYKFDGDFIESQAFGYLAIRSFLKLPISFPKTTGCITPTIGGQINKNFD